MVKDKKKYVIELRKEKETKNTIRYVEVPAKGRPEVLRTVYIQKWVVGNYDEAPEKITITVEV